MAFTDIVNFDFNFRQLQISRSLDIFQEGEESAGAPGIQVYDSIGGGYYPDYTTFPLVIQPNITVSDPDEVLASQDTELRINKDLANMQWTVKEEGQADLRVTNTLSAYSVETAGDNLGRLTIMRNITPYKPLTLVFHADYQDPRNGELRPIDMTYLVQCDITIQQCVLKLDIPNYFLFNPLEGSTKTVHASVYSGDQRVPNDQCRCKWQIRDHDAWADVGSRVDLDFAVPSSDTMSLTINMSYMGKENVFRCITYVGADSAEAQSKMGLNEVADERTFRIRRQLPSFNSRISATPRSIPMSQKEIYPVAKLDFANYSGGSRSKLESEVRSVWSTGYANRLTSTNFTKVAEGLTPVIKADKVTQKYGQMLKLEIEDRGSYSIITDGSGKPIADGSGRIFLGR